MTMRVIVLLIFSSSICAALGQLYDPLQILEQSDKFLNPKPFESAFYPGKYAQIISNEGSGSVSQYPSGEDFEVKEVLKDQVIYLHTYWESETSASSFGEDRLMKSYYDEHMGNRLRKKVQSLREWGDDIQMDSAAKVRVKIGSEYIYGLEVRFTDTTPFSPAGIVFYRMILIPRHYFAQVALEEYYIPLPGVPVVRELLKKYR